MKAIYKNIFWRTDIKPDKNGLGFANVHVLANCKLPTLFDLQNMAEELRKTFPQTKDSEIYCGHIIDSDYPDYKDCTILVWNAFIPPGDYPDWNKIKDGQRNYYWV